MKHPRRLSGIGLARLCEGAARGAREAPVGVMPISTVLMQVLALIIPLELLALVELNERMWQH